MNDTDDSLRALYADPPMDEAAEHRLDAWIATHHVAPPDRRRHAVLSQWAGALASTAVVATVAVVSFTFLTPTAGNRPTTVPSNGGQGTSSTGRPSSQPVFYVAHAPTQTGKPGAIAVYDTATGRVIRTLGADYDPYPMNGFVLSPDRRTLYYTRLSEQAQKVEIVSVPVVGGRVQVLADGRDPRPSPDGTQIAYWPEAQPGTVAVMNLSTGGVTTSQVPAQTADTVTQNLAWLSGSGRLLVTDASYPQAPGCPGVASCVPPRRKQIASDAYLVRTSGSQLEWSALPNISGGGISWAQLQTVGATGGAGEILATAASAQGTSDETLYKIDPLTGTVVAAIALPAGHALLAIDSGGDQLLLTGGNSGSVEMWRPGQNEPTQIGPPATEAAW